LTQVHQGRGLRIAICIPAHDMCHTQFMYDLAKMMGHLGAGPIADGVIEAISIQLVQGTYVQLARQELANMCLELDVDYSLWLDSDMRFPSDTLTRLLLRKEDIVGINYSTRGVPANFVAIKKVGGKDGPGKKLETLEDSTGLEEAEAIGFGAVLIRNRVFKRLHERKPIKEHGPWFKVDWCDYLKRIRGEDVNFCMRAREVGFRVMVDHDLSKECQHLGTFPYRLEHAEACLGVEERGYT
jgi:hypothetical protein